MQAEVEQRGLGTSGNKDELRQRLEESDTGDADANVASAAPTDPDLDHGQGKDESEMTQAELGARHPFGTSGQEESTVPAQMRPENQDEGVAEGAEEVRRMTPDGLYPGAHDHEDEESTPGGTLPPV